MLEGSESQNSYMLYFQHCEMKMENGRVKVIMKETATIVPQTMTVARRNKKGGEAMTKTLKTTAMTKLMVIKPND